MAKVAKQDDTNSTVRKFLAVMDSVTARMINCELQHFGLVGFNCFQCALCKIVLF